MHTCPSAPHCIVLTSPRTFNAITPTVSILCCFRFSDSTERFSFEIIASSSVGSEFAGWNTVPRPHKSTIRAMPNLQASCGQRPLRIDSTTKKLRQILMICANDRERTGTEMVGRRLLQVWRISRHHRISLYKRMSSTIHDIAASVVGSHLFSISSCYRCSNRTVTIEASPNQR